MGSLIVADKIRVGVLFGGQSGEHEVSLVSARAVMDGLDRAKYDVVPIGITKQGRWIAGGDALPALEAMADPKKLPGGPPELKIENEKLKSATAEENQPQTALAIIDSQFSILNSQFSQ
jgi:D-alanine-D-alanine ligase